MNKAVFFDRDGTIIEEKNYIKEPCEIELFDGVAEGIKLLKDRGFYVFLVSNQSGVARGYFTEDDVKKINKEIAAQLAHAGVIFDDYYYCPHYPHGIVPRYSVVCDCRKPSPGMALKAKKKYEIDLEQSFVIGDKISDMEFAKKINATSILVRTGYGRDVRGGVFDHEVKNIVAACELIVQI